MKISKCGENIQKYREIIGMSQAELAHRMGITQQLLWKYENKRITNIPSDRIQKAAEILGVTPNALFGREENLTEDTANTLADVSLDKELIEHVRLLGTMPEKYRSCVYEIARILSRTTSP